MLKKIPYAKRTAVFRCVVAIAFPSGLERVFEGKCAGRIVLSPVGTGGFGYDPLFKPVRCGKTFSQLTKHQKNKISHRFKAFRKADVFLRRVFHWDPEKLDF